MTFRNFIYNTASFLILVLIGFSACKKNPSTHVSGGLSSDRDTIILNEKYGSDPKQVCDIYLQAGRNPNTPCILVIHGGAWKAGQKEDFNPYINMIRSKWQNVAVINMNYRLASNDNNIHHDQIMADIDAAIGHIVSNITKYQISDKIGIVGASAGGHLAMIYAYKYNRLQKIKCVGDIFGPSYLNDWAWYDSNNILLGGYVGDVLAEYVGRPWDTAVYKAVSPYWNISAQSQPTIIFHGNLDPIVPVYQSQQLHTKLTSLGVPNQYHEYQAFHGFDQAQSIDVINKLVAFFQAKLQ
jgi:acetyl esterase/lipase